MKTVLLTDDNEDIIELVELILSKLGYELKKATNGEEAIKYCMESPPDLVIMDLYMPDVDGFTAIESLRKNGFEQPIVVLTASESQEDKNRAMELGCNGYIIKTMEMKDLEATVYKLLEFQEN